MLGYTNELVFVNYLDGRKVKDLNIMFLELIEALYENLSPNDIILSWKNPFRQKTDIFIKINDCKKRLSLKTGIKNSVHMEPISEFISFLIKNGIPRQQIINYLRYQYADGTTNGTGDIRISVEEYKKNHQKEIDEINSYLNNEQILLKAINRFILKGNNDINEIDALVYGTNDDFIFITKEEIKEIILTKCNLYSTGVHFGPLSCQPMNRCLNYNKKYENLRYCVQIKWYSLFDDILEYKNKKLIDKVLNS